MIISLRPIGLLKGYSNVSLVGLWLNRLVCGYSGIAENESEYPSKRSIILKLNSINLSQNNYNYDNWPTFSNGILDASL